MLALKLLSVQAISKSSPGMTDDLKRNEVIPHSFSFFILKGTIHLKSKIHE